MKYDQVIEKIQSYAPTHLRETSLSAAVLIILMYDELGEIELILTKRSQSVTKYAGDYCFPGGNKENYDADFKMTVTREVQEELSMCPQTYTVIGQLDDFYDRYGHLVRPYVAVISKDKFEAVLSQEIEKIYFFPLSDLENMQVDKALEKVTKRHPAYKYIKDDAVIWGLTASLMVHLYNVLFGTHFALGKGTDVSG